MRLQDEKSDQGIQSASKTNTSSVRQPALRQEETSLAVMFCGLHFGFSEISAAFTPWFIRIIIITIEVQFTCYEICPFKMCNSGTLSINTLNHK